MIQGMLFQEKEGLNVYLRIGRCNLEKAPVGIIKLYNCI